MHHDSATHDSATHEAGRAWLEALPRIPLGFLPTPLVPLDRLSARLAAETVGRRPAPRIWLKRDDCTGLATGGNKTRKLEYLLAEARSAGADTVLTYGAVQSNHARQTAAACAALGLACHLLLARRVPWPHPGYESSGNVLLDRLCGATVEIVEPTAMAAASRARIDALRVAGRRTYLVPTGGSNPTGALGYVRCALELLDQAREHGFELTDVVHATSSAGTQAGLLAGFAAFVPAPARRPAVHGINVYQDDHAALVTTVTDMTRQLLDAHRPDVVLDDGAVRIDSRHLGAGYGLPTAQTLEAIRLAASLEGVLFDPVYSGKALGGLIAGIRAGEFAAARDVVFIHTGGAASLAVYDQAFG